MHAMQQEPGDGAKPVPPLSGAALPGTPLLNFQSHTPAQLALQVKIERTFHALHAKIAQSGALNINDYFAELHRAARNEALISNALNIDTLTELRMLRERAALRPALKALLGTVQNGLLDDYVAVSATAGSALPQNIQSDVNAYNALSRQLRQHLRNTFGLAPIASSAFAAELETFVHYNTTGLTNQRQQFLVERLTAVHAHYFPLRGALPLLQQHYQIDDLPAHLSRVVNKVFIGPYPVGVIDRALDGLNGKP